MKNNEKILQATIEIRLIEERIDELKRTRTYLNNPTYYNNRMKSLESQKREKQAIIIAEKCPVEEEFVIELHVPSGHRSNFRFDEPQVKERIQQFLKREFIGVVTE